MQHSHVTDQQIAEFIYPCEGVNEPVSVFSSMEKSEKREKKRKKGRRM